MLCLPWAVRCINGAAARQQGCECDLPQCVGESLGVLLGAQEKPARWRRKRSSCSAMWLLPGADLGAGIGVCFSSWLTTVLREMVLLPLSPDCYVTLLRSFFKNPASINSIFLCVPHCSCLVMVHLSSSLPQPLPIPPAR